MKYKRYVVAALIAGCFAAALTATQSSPEHHAHITFDNPPSRFTLAKEKPVTIKIRNIGPYGVLALQPIKSLDTIEQSLIVKAWTLTNTEPESKPGSRRKAIGISPLAPAALRFNDNILEIDGSARKNRNITVHITVPDLVDANVSINGETMHTGPLQTDILIRGTEIVEGKVSASEGRAAIHSLLGAIHGDLAPRIDPDAAPVSMQPGAVIRLPWAKLAELVTERVEPNVGALGNNIGSDQQWALVDLFVDESGRVTKTSTKPFGNAALGIETAQVLSRWRFQPYVFREQPIKVRSTVYVLLKNGSIVLQQP